MIKTLLLLQKPVRERLASFELAQLKRQSLVMVSLAVQRRTVVEPASEQETEKRRSLVPTAKEAAEHQEQLFGLQRYL